MAKRLLELFDDAAKVGKDAASSPPRNLTQMTVSGSTDTDALKAKIDLTNRVVPRIDYSDFSNFVFFNSALDYFNISGERVINEHPYDGTLYDQLAFQSESDHYQNWLLTNWPRSSGCVDFSGSSNIIVNDSLAKSNLSGAGYTVEFHCEPPSGVLAGEVRFVFQMLDSSGSNVLCGYFLPNGDFEVLGDTDRNEPVPSGTNYLAWVGDPNEIASSRGRSLYFATESSSVALSNGGGSPPSATGTVSTIIIGSGTHPSFSSSGVPLSLREFRLWNKPKTLDELQANYNTRVFKDDSLLYYARMTEGSGSSVRDYSGNKLNGTLVGVWGTSSLGMGTQDQSDLILDWRNDTLKSFISTWQGQASSFDRNNEHAITRMVPEQFLLLEDEMQTSVLRNMLYLLARQFDELKVAIDQFPKALLATNTGFDDAPDALLEDALKFWGWDPKGSFLSKEAFQFFFGYNVLSGDQADYDNQRLETTLAEIKSAFWRRTLQNLPYIYKRKGTREAVEALLRVYGLDEKIVKLKEFGMKPDVSIQTNRINSEKSATAIRVSGAFTIESPDQSIAGYDANWTQNMWIRFPAPDDDQMPPTFETGSVSHFYQVGGAGQALPILLSFPLGGPITTVNLKVEELRYARPLTGTTGSFTWISYDGGAGVTSGTWNNVPVFDGRWYHLMVHRHFHVQDNQSHLELHIGTLDEDTRVHVYEDNVLTTASIDPGGYAYSIGRHYVSGVGFNPTQGGEFWVRNVQVWSLEQSISEMIDHVLNPFSYGTDLPAREMNLSLNWQFDQEKDATIGAAFDSSPHANKIVGSLYLNDSPVPFASASYYRDVFEYNFIAPPEYGWNEDKIRIVSGTKTQEGEKWNENSSLSLEFNLIDALNEDISFMLSSLDNWNNIIGAPANRYRASYPQLDRLRKQYFSRLTGRINFRVFADFLDFFDRSFVEMVAKLLPAEARFKGAEFVVESHMLERPKVQYTYRRFSPQLVPEGRIVIYGHEPLRYQNPVE